MFCQACIDAARRVSNGDLTNEEGNQLYPDLGSAAVHGADAQHAGTDTTGTGDVTGVGEGAHATDEYVPHEA